MAKKTLRDVDVAGKRVLIRVDFNVPQEANGAISNDRRIRSALPTIHHALEKGAAVILMSHLGRPKGTDPSAEPALRMDRAAKRLQELLPGAAVFTSPETVGPETIRLASELKPGQVLVLENLRFHPSEQKYNEAFARELRSLADIYVNDAFGTCHRKDASMFGVPGLFDEGSRVVGFLVEKELEILDGLLTDPKKPMVAIMGGAKVSDKIAFIEAILRKVDKLLIGGAMTYTFRMAMGQSVGKSLVERDKLELANELRQKAGDRLVLPVDHVIADKLGAGASIRIVEDEIPDGWLGLDIGPKTREMYRNAIHAAATVLWNGPMGKFEDEPYRAGTLSVARAMADHGAAVTVVGGGESAEAVEQFGLVDKMAHVSTGGGAFLEYVEGKPFAPLSVIDEK